MEGSFRVLGSLTQITSFDEIILVRIDHTIMLPIKQLFSLSLRLSVSDERLGRSNCWLINRSHRGPFCSTTARICRRSVCRSLPLHFYLSTWIVLTPDTTFSSSLARYPPVLARCEAQATGTVASCQDNPSALLACKLHMKPLGCASLKYANEFRCMRHIS